MIKPKIYQFFSILLMVAYLSISRGVVVAAPGQLKQSIVPLECYIDAVNSGNGSHLYITPEDCLEEKATETIEEAEIPSIVINSLREYGQESSESLQANPKSQEYDPSKSQQTGAVNLYDNLKSDPATTLFLISVAAVPISIGLYLFLRPLISPAKKE